MHGKQYGKNELEGEQPEMASIKFERGISQESEPVFLSVYGAQESIPRNDFRQSM